MLLKFIRFSTLKDFKREKQYRRVEWGKKEFDFFLQVPQRDEQMQGEQKRPTFNFKKINILGIKGETLENNFKKFKDC
jgi:hypothetical protein